MTPYYLCGVQKPEDGFGVELSPPGPPLTTSLQQARAGGGNDNICEFKRQGAHSPTTIPAKQTSLWGIYLLPIPIDLGGEIQRHKEPLSSSIPFPNAVFFPFTPKSSILHRITSSPQWQENGEISPRQLLPTIIPCARVGSAHTDPSVDPSSVACGAVSPVPASSPAPKLLSQRTPSARLSPVEAAGILSPAPSPWPTPSTGAHDPHQPTWP